MKNITKIEEQNDGTSLYELAILPKLELPTFFSYRERKVSKHPAGLKKRIAFKSAYTVIITENLAESPRL